MFLNFEDVHAETYKELKVMRKKRGDGGSAKKKCVSIEKDKVFPLKLS